MIVVVLLLLATAFARNARRHQAPDAPRRVPPARRRPRRPTATGALWPESQPDLPHRVTGVADAPPDAPPAGPPAGDERRDD